MYLVLSTLYTWILKGMEKVATFVNVCQRINFM